MKFPLVAVSIVALTAIVSAPVAATPDPKASTYQTTQVVVEFSNATLSASSILAAVSDAVKYESSVSPKTRVYEVAGTPGSLELAQNITKLRSLTGVVSADIDSRMYPMTAPDDPLLADQWALDDGYGVDAVASWQFSQGEGVRVAVVDTGIVSHEDLTTNVVGGYDFISDATTANDGGGRDSDPTDTGDWATNEVCGYTSPSSWHGTHVAGIIAAVGDNGIGVSGVAPKATIVPIRALGRCGGSTSDVFAGARWAAGLGVSGIPNNPYPAKIINMSLGSAQACPSWMQSVINEIASVGALIVVAAGNSNQDAATFSPASCNNVMTVASTTAQGARSSFSNYGASVDIAAPGSSVLNTVDVGTTVAAGSGYAYMSGTSMASPHVAGVAALVLALQPSLSLADLRSRLLDTATAFATTPGCTTCGSGIVNAPGALASSVSALLPGPPTGITATPNQTGVRVSWTAPSSVGGSAVTSYVVSGGPGCETSALWCDVTGLTPGVEYQFSVQAKNSYGSGPSSTIVTAVFVTVPSAPQTVAATLTDELTAQVTWAAPLTNGGSAITKYVVTGSPSGTCETTSLMCVFSGLTVGTSYSFQVVAENIAGTSPAAASNSAQTAAAPATPIALNIEISSLTMTATWSQGQGPGLSTYDYVLSVTPGNHRCETTSTSCQITGLSSGTQYEVSLVARGPQSTTSSALLALANTPPAAPNLPTTTSPSVPPTTSTPDPTPDPTPSPTPDPAPNVETVTTTTPALPSTTVAPPSTSVATTTTPPSSKPSPVVVKRASTTRLSKIMLPPPKATAKWTVTGGCRITGVNLVAPKTAGTCKLTLQTTTNGVKSTRSRLITITDVPTGPPTTKLSAVVVKRSSTTRLSKIMLPPPKATAKWTVTGGCLISGVNLIAPKTAGTCKLTLQTTTNGVKSTRSSVVTVK